MADTVPAVNPDRACQHRAFVANVAVNRVGEEDPGSGGMPRAYVADIIVQCAPAPDGCGEPFRFSGVPIGLSYDHPMCSVDQTELRAPIRPASSDPDFGQGLPGFSVRQVL